MCYNGKKASMMPPETAFRPPLLSDAESVARCTQNTLQSDLSFANIYLLREKYGTEIMFHVEHLLRYFGGTARLQGYAFPAGCGTSEAIETCLNFIENHAKTQQNKLKFCLLTEKEAEFLCRRYGKRAQVTTDAGDADYLYLRDDLAFLAGTKFHKKRTHISKFEREHPSWSFESLTPANAAEAIKVAEQWLITQGDSPALRHEFKAIGTALEHMEQLKLSGGLLRVEGKAVAFSVVSIINPLVADIHYEKCLPEYRDAYPLINRETARMLTTQYINREEDLNIEGLRKAKLSYHPHTILKKFNLTVNPC